MDVFICVQATVLGDGSWDENDWLTEETEHSENEGIPSSPSSPLKQESNSSGKIVLHIYRNVALDKLYSEQRSPTLFLKGYSVCRLLFQPSSNRLNSTKPLSRLKTIICCLFDTCVSAGLEQKPCIPRR